MPHELVKWIAEHHSLEKYSNVAVLKQKAVQYVGTPKKNSENTDRIFLRTDPSASDGSLLEFRIGDVLYVEEMETITTKEGGASVLMKLWIKKGSVGVKLEPFIVES